ncbi:MAG: MOSC domain-containing protein [Syntrophomonadaceae bacterium]
MGKICAISVSTKKGIPKTNVPSARLIENFGIEGDAHAGNWHRQVSLLALESIEKMKALGLPLLKPGIFAENLTTQFLNLPEIVIGTRIKIGREAEIEITQIGKECHKRCAIYYKAGDCIMPKEGIFARVIKSGDIFIDDQVVVFNEVNLER